MRKRSNGTASLFAIIGLMAAVEGAEAQTFLVNNPGDDGSGTLRRAILAANAAGGPARIDFADGLGTIQLRSALPMISRSVTLDGGIGNAVSGAGQQRIFFVDAPGGSVAINNLLLLDGRAKGGDGNSGGGGGAGLGGALFVNAGEVTVSGVRFAQNAAAGGAGGVGIGGGGGGIGGNGGAGNPNFTGSISLAGGGGGGGFAGNGGSGGAGQTYQYLEGSGGGGGGLLGHGGDGLTVVRTTETGGGGGGGGPSGNGFAGQIGVGGQSNGIGGIGGGRVDAIGGNGSPGGPGTGGGGGSGAAEGANGGDGGKGAGGGGGGRAAEGGNGGRGGFGGGGGGGGRAAEGAGGGQGGFAGGGGAGGNAADHYNGGNGGFGGGGGARGDGARGGEQPGMGGLGGGNGSAVYLGGNDYVSGGGGGGAAFGGAVFVRPDNGASLRLLNTSIDQGSLTAGPGASGSGDGQAAGSALFLPGGKNEITVDGHQGQTIAGSIAGSSPSSLSKLGRGTLILSGDSGGRLGYSGGTTVAQGTLLVDNASGTGTGSGSVEILRGATLGGHGSIAGNVMIHGGGHLASGPDGLGSLNWIEVTQLMAYVQ